MKTKRHLPILIILLWTAVVLAACGGNVAKAGMVELTVEGKDTFQFSPDTASIPAGAEVALTFKNTGALNHSLIITAEDIDPLRYRESDALAGINTGIVPTGKEVELTFTAPAPGTYTYVCVIPGHAAAGMVGTLTVTGSQISDNN